MKNFWQKLKKPLIGLAPMDGVTDEPMRQIQVTVAKPDVLYTEFVSAEGFQKNPQAFEKRLFFQENERPIIAQVFGCTPKAFYDTVLQISQLGFDGIDLNFGCPARNILKRGGGGALIGEYKKAGRIIESALNALKESKTNLPLSVKTRIGQKKPITRKWIGFLCQFPLAEISLHGRVLSQGLSGPVNWPEIKLGAQIAASKGIFLLGNGGIKSLAEAKRKAKDFSPDGVLIGQAALGNPWIFRKDFSPSQEEIMQTIVRHAELVEDFYPANKFIPIRKHFGWYSRNFRHSKSLKIALMKTSNLNEVKIVIESFRQNRF